MTLSVYWPLAKFSEQNLANSFKDEMIKLGMLPEPPLSKEIEGLKDLQELVEISKSYDSNIDFKKKDRDALSIHFKKLSKSRNNKEKIKHLQEILEIYANYDYEVSKEHENREQEIFEKNLGVEVYTNKIKTMKDLEKLLKSSMNGAEEESLKGLDQLVFRNEIRLYFSDAEIDDFIQFASEHYDFDKQIKPILDKHDYNY